MNLKLISLFLILFSLNGQNINSKTERQMEKKVFYCEYCGHKFYDVRSLTSSTCSRHPDGSNKGRHKLYEGSEKTQYTCKYCGKRFPSIMALTASTCLNHPKGSHKGQHSPAL